MIVREMRPDDVGTLRDLHREMGSEYPLPDLESPTFYVEVLADDNDIPVMAICCRRTVETYLLMDQKWRTPKWRFSGFAMLHDRVIARLKRFGYTDAHCWITPELVERFGMKRLVKQFGWMRSAWTSFLKEF